MPECRAPHSGTVVLHVAPDAASGGPLGLVRTGDRIKISVSERRIDLLVDETTLGRRRKEQSPASKDSAALRGYDRLYAEQILQADEGCDFEFLLPEKRA